MAAQERGRMSLCDKFYPSIFQKISSKQKAIVFRISYDSPSYPRCSCNRFNYQGSRECERRHYLI